MDNINRSTKSSSIDETFQFEEHIYIYIYIYAQSALTLT